RGGSGTWHGVPALSRSRDPARDRKSGRGFAGAWGARRIGGRFGPLLEPGCGRRVLARSVARGPATGELRLPALGWLGMKEGVVNSAQWRYDSPSPKERSVP